MPKISVLRSLKGGSLSRTEVVLTPDGKMRVRKSVSWCEDREFGLVRWQSQIRKLQYLKNVLPQNIPDILEIGVNGNFFFYDIPYFDDSANLYEHLKAADGAEGEAIFAKVLDLISSYSSLDFGESLGAAALFFHEEIDTRLQLAEDWLQADKSPFFNDTERQEVARLMRGFRKHKNRFRKFLQKLATRECLTHGNLTLENVLLDRTTGRLILIDPYGETYCESVLGDYSQLLQSSDSNYEQIVEAAEDSKVSLLESPALAKLDGIAEFNRCLQSHLATFSEKDRALIDIFHGGQFIRMFPFKVQKTPRLAYFFLLRGLEILMRQSDAV